MDLLLVTSENKSRYVYIKDLDRFMFHKTKTKNTFAKVVSSVLALKCVLLLKHKELFLNINGAQSVRLEQGKIKFKSYIKQIPVQYKMYAEFECNQDHIPCIFAYKLVCVDDKFT